MSDNRFTFHMLYDVLMYGGVSCSLLLTWLHHPLNCTAFCHAHFDCCDQNGSVYSFLFSVNGVYCLFFVHLTPFLYFLLLPGAFALVGLYLTFWAGDKMMKLHSQMI